MHLKKTNEDIIKFSRICEINKKSESMKKKMIDIIRVK